MRHSPFGVSEPDTDDTANLLNMPREREWSMGEVVLRPLLSYRETQMAPHLPWFWYSLGFHARPSRLLHSGNTNRPVGPRLGGLPRNNSGRNAPHGRADKRERIWNRPDKECPAPVKDP